MIQSKKVTIIKTAISLLLIGGGLPLICRATIIRRQAATTTEISVPAINNTESARTTESVLATLHGADGGIIDIPIPANNPVEQQESLRRHRQFGKIWLNRRTISATQPLLELLTSEQQQHLRERLIIALGRLEDPQAVQPLQDLLKHVRHAQRRGRPLEEPFEPRDDIPVYRINLALGRIGARDLTGEAKLNAIARSVGTTWPKLRALGNQLRKAIETQHTAKYRIQDSDESGIIEEFYYVLYEMGKKGEDIQLLGGYDLLIWPNDKAILDAASLSNDAEIKFWLDRATPPSVGGFYPEHLIDLGPRVPDALLEQLKKALAKVKADPAVVKNFGGAGLGPMMKAAAATEDPRFIPILREFEKIKDRGTRIHTAKALRAMEGKLPVLTFP